MNMKKLAWVLLPITLALGVIAGIFIGKGSIGNSASTDKRAKLQAILDIIDNEYVDQVNVDSLLELSFADLIAQLDPHSVYIPASELTATNEDLDGSFSGVGISFQILNDTVTVVEVISGGPAEKVGILAGDRIIQAGTKKLAGNGVTNEDVFKTLRGKAGTKVKMDIQRRGVDKLLSYDVIRGEIPVNSVDASYMIEPGIGYVKVGKFAKNTFTEFYDALGNLSADGAKKYVIDLRGNGGGFMDQAILMANEFLPEGQKIVYTKGRNPVNDMEAFSNGNGSYTDVELVVLMNESSASASEIFAGAIQDNDRGLIIGRRSFGKGLVQNQTTLPDSSAIRLTVARYYTPSGRSIQKEYEMGKEEKYSMDLIDRYNHGEFYNVDSVKLDKSKKYTTLNGRVVYGGGGIMPDVFVPEDTIGMTSYYLDVVNKGLPQKYSFDYTDRYRTIVKGIKNVDDLLRVIPTDRDLLIDFVDYAEREGEPSRWYYINQSEALLLRQIKSMIARDVLGYQSFYKIFNQGDKTINEALRILKNGESPVNIPNTSKP